MDEDQGPPISPKLAKVLEKFLEVMKVDETIDEDAAVRLDALLRSRKAPNRMLKMNTHIKFAVADSTICARHVDALRRFLVQEAESLKEILDLFGKYEASDAVVELEGLCAVAPPDVTAVGMALETVLHALEDLPFLVLEHVAMSGQGPRDLHAAVR